ncbi:MAG: nucleotide exchange factor GrpE [Ammonifex sp.]|jgi:molecular chaperone GrpE|nr:MAG: nucleotide exchange factor GrpE [Ammonifex sp.]
MVEQDKHRRGGPNGESNSDVAPDRQLAQKQEALPGEADGVEIRTTSPEEHINVLEEALTAAENRAQEYYQQLLRLRADYENLRKRVNKEREEFLHFAGEALVASLLPVLDDFERALKSPGDKVSDFLAGIEMIYRRLSETFTHEGLEVIPAVGALFDPTRHEAVAFEEDGEHPANTILEELRRGYTFRGKVLRPALVKVAKEKEM